MDTTEALYLGRWRSPVQAGFVLLQDITRRDWLRRPAVSFEAMQQMFHDDGRGAGALNLSTGAPAPHSYDKHKAWLGTAAGVKLGVGTPVHVVAPEFADRAGVWLVRVADTSPYTDVFPVPERWLHHPTWLYTPLLHALVRLGYTFTAQEAYLFSEQHTVLRPFYQAMREHLDQAATPAEVRQLKDIYTRTFGALAHFPEKATSATFLYRPDWYYTLISEANARMFYQMLAVYEAEGVAPEAIETDKLFYAQPVQSLRLGEGIGQYSYEYRPDRA